MSCPATLLGSGWVWWLAVSAVLGAGGLALMGLVGYVLEGRTDGQDVNL